jgi:hypothetical protein
VAGLDDKAKLAKYDPKGIIGFCFGRSMAAHLLARQVGLREDSIRTLFAIGNLHVTADLTWRFHVTTVVKGQDGLWYALDPIMAGPMPAEAWIAQVRAAWDKPGKAKFYFASADTIIPDIRVVPAPAQETGARIIEHAFAPAGKIGFTPMREFAGEVFMLSPEALRTFFLLAEAPSDPFDFAGITINGTPFSYNGYFSDLLADLFSAAAASSSRG